MSLRVAALVEALGATLIVPGASDGPDSDIELTSAGHDSRSVQQGALYCCVRGANFDGHGFAADAVASGAAALLVEHRVEVDVPQIVVPDVRRAMGPAASLILGEPSKRLDVIGVTGTNGKTTTVHLLGTILGRDASMVETMGTLTGARTTPEGPELQASLASAAERGVRYLAMEVSSHALDLHRVDGTRFRAVIFTNLGRDHLDHHGDLEAYYQAKARLFTPEFAEVAIINTDDPAGLRLAASVEAAGGMRVERIGLDQAVGLRVDGPVARFDWEGLPIELHLAGRYNVLNALGAATAARVVGCDPVDIADALCAADPPRGRFEFVDVGQSFQVAVDYAHTPDAITAVLAAGHESAGSDGRVLLVFGCGGDRDRAKRSLMGRAAVEGADLVVLTSDNPRSEDPAEIIAEVAAGFGDRSSRTAEVIIEPDRARAIATAIGAAQAGDVVVIAGKGHETEQIIADVHHPFDDRQVAVESLLRLAGQDRHVAGGLPK